MSGARRPITGSVFYATAASNGFAPGFRHGVVVIAAFVAAALALALPTR